MKYLLDTNVCIAIIKERLEEVKARLLKIPIGEIGMILFQIKCRQRWQKLLSNHASVGVQEYRITFLPH